MNGAESPVRGLVGCGVSTCLANPGTSAMHFVAALDRVPAMRCVLGLAETVGTGNVSTVGDRATCHISREAILAPHEEAH